MASFLAVDAVVSKFFSVSQVALWAYIKSTLLLASTICIFGLDQVIVRRPEGLRTIARYLGVRILITSTILAVGLFYFKPDTTLFFWVVCVSLTALLSVFYAIYRGAYHMVIAQFSLNGWKTLVFVFCLILAIYRPNYGVDAATAISLSLAAIYVCCYAYFAKEWRAYYLEQEQRTPLPTRDNLLTEAKHFFLLSLSLNLSINFEQLALNILGFDNASATLLAHFSIFIPGVVFLNGFLGFYLGPFLKRRESKIARPFFIRINSYFLICGAFFCALSFFGGHFAFTRFYGDKYQLDHYLAFALVSLGYLRFLYTIPSSFIGVLGSTVYLKRYSSLNMAFFAVSILLFAGLIYNQFDPTKSVILASLTNWLLRVVYGYRLAYADIANKIDNG